MNIARNFSAEPPSPLTSALFLFMAVCLVGSAGFMWIEGWSFEESLYFTLISITTVGYGDQGASDTGKLYALVVVLSGFGITTYTFSLLMQRAVSNGLRWRDRMQAQIDALTGHSIVCGYGRMGRTICAELAHENASFVVIEEGEKQYEKAVEDGVLVLRGSAADDEVLERAGVRQAAHIVSAVDGEMENIAVTLSASELNPDIEIIARAERDSEVRKLFRAGATRTVSPFRAGGLDAANALLRPAIADCLMHTSEEDCPVELAQVPVEPGSILDGDELARFGQDQGRDAAFVALQHAGGELTISPSGSTRLRAGDTLIVAARPDRVPALRSMGSNVARALRAG